MMSEGTHESPNALQPVKNAPLHSLQDDLAVFREAVVSHTGGVARRRQSRRSRARGSQIFLNASLSLGAALFAFMAVAGVVLAIIVPPWYQGLPPFDQAVWCNRLSFLCGLRREAPSGNVLGLQGTSSAEEADALLQVPTPSPTLFIVPTPTSPVEATNAVAALPTASPTPSPTPSPSPTVTVTPLPESALLDVTRLKWEQQGWNNCGPTTMTVSLSYFGYARDQSRAAGFMKPYLEDKNVSPHQMVAYVNTVAAEELPVRALYRVGGTPQMLRRFTNGGFPVIIERGIEVANDGWMGHYSLVVGYDDATGEYLLYDTYYGYGRSEGGTGRREKQDKIEAGWQQFNYTLIVLYDPLRENEVRDILGEHADPARAAEFAFETARRQATLDPDDKWAWFNMGSSLTLLGRYDDAVKAFDRARTYILPFRMLWYQFGPYIAYFHVGRYDDVLALALSTERTTPYVEETYFYRGLVYAAQNNPDSAILQFDRALRYNKNFTQAEEAKQQILEGRFDKNTW